MTTFKNNAKYAELIFLYLDVAIRDDTPITVQEVLSTFAWRFKGGSLKEASESTAQKPETSEDVYPDGLSSDILSQWPNGLQARALRRILVRRAEDGRMKARAIAARLATFLMLTSGYGISRDRPVVYTGMKSIYYLFGRCWEWSRIARKDESWTLLQSYTKELTLGMSGVSRLHVPTAEDCRRDYEAALTRSRVVGLLQCVRMIKEVIRVSGSKQARDLARADGVWQTRRWQEELDTGKASEWVLVDRQADTRYLTVPLGDLMVRVGQSCAMVMVGKDRVALGKSDMERLHQMLMSAASCVVGVCAQASVGTLLQKRKALGAIRVAEANIDRLVASSRMVKLGDEVLVCKAYRRAYTAHLGNLAGHLCTIETDQLIKEAEETCEPGVIDVRGFLWDAMQLDASSSLNACKVFKICPAPDVSPGGAMIDRILQVGNGNSLDDTVREDLRSELTSQILRAYVRKKKGRLRLRNDSDRPIWHNDYMRGDFDRVPSYEIAKYYAWEGDATMPDVSVYDAANWKDSGIGADTIVESEGGSFLGVKNNMLTRLVFDDDCPMPGRQVLNHEHVVKFFVKPEGHKDPARGIFSANLTDRQAQSWMERAVDQVAREHPSFMIGQGIDERMAKVAKLTARPRQPFWVHLYYSFDISGWSAKMPADVQRMSHEIWGTLYGGHMFSRAHEINEGAHIYLNLDGYKGWFRNTGANLEGFNGKEMTMVLVSLLSLSVGRWRQRVIEEGVMSTELAMSVSALLFAYIDDGLSRITLPMKCAKAAFELYKMTVIETFSKCGFTVEVSKCFPSDRFAIFLNEVYLSGRHVVHGVRAAMGISAEPTERHTSLVERLSGVLSGVRGAVIAGLDVLAATFLLAYHALLHLEEWVTERDPVVLAAWCLCARSWGGLGFPNVMQLAMSGSACAFEESVSTFQFYAGQNPSVRKAYVTLARQALVDRDATSVMTAPLSGRNPDGYMVDSRVAVAVRRSLQVHVKDGSLSRYARRLLLYADTNEFESFAEAIIPRDRYEVMQEQMLNDLCESHPHVIFTQFARRLEKANTLRQVVGHEVFNDIVRANREEAAHSAFVFHTRFR